jgi:polysaccharide transporter, PST family
MITKRTSLRSLLEAVGLRLPQEHLDRYLNGGLLSIVRNFAWLSGDRIVRMGVALLVGAAVARHLSPQGFGVMAFAIAISELVGCFVSLGFESLLPRELLRHPEQTNTLHGTGFWCTLAAAVLLYLGVIVPIAMFASKGPEGTASLLLAGLLFFRAPLGLLNLQFTVQLRAEFGVMAANIGFLISTAVRLWLIFTGASVIAFVAVLLIEPFGAAIATYIFYRRAGYRVTDWRWDGALARRLLRESWPLILSGFATIIYMRMDQVMLAYMRDEAEVGLYGAALRFSEVWYFLPMALASSLFPALVRTREVDTAAYLSRLQRYYDFNAVFAYGLIILLVPMAPWLFQVFFGQSYTGADAVFQLHIWACLCVFLGIASSQHIAIEGWTRFAFLSTTLGAVSNLALNFAFIPQWGASGSAAATVISQACSTFLACFLWAPTRPNGWMQVRALLIPVRAAGWLWVQGRRYLLERAASVQTCPEETTS